MDGHGRKNSLVETSSDCANILSEKNIEGPFNDCTNMVGHEEICFNAEKVLQKEMVKNTGNLTENSESSNPPIRLSDETGDHGGNDFLGSSSVGHVHPGSSPARDAFAVDDYQDSSASSQGDYNLGSNSARHDSPRGVDSLGLKSSRNASHFEDGYKCSICTSHASNPGHDSWTADHIDHKKQCRTVEEDKVNSFQDTWTKQSHDDSNHRSSSLEGHAVKSQSPGVASGLSHNHHYPRYDDHPRSSQARDASHGIGQDLVSKSRSASNEYKHDDRSGSSSAGIIKDSSRKGRKLECSDLMTGQGEDYHPSLRSRRHVPYVRNNNRYTNISTNERNLSRRIQQDEFSNIRPSTVTIRRAERDDEPFDICNIPNFFASRELSPPPQSNETYKKIENLMPGMFLLKKWLSEHEQDALVKKCQELGLGKGGFFQPSFDSGKKMCLRMMCLGRNWNHRTQRYEKIRAHDNAQPPAIPVDFVPLVHRAIEDCRNELRKDHTIRTQGELLEALPGLDPDVCIVNFYEETGRLGVHQDKDESPASLAKGLPVVSFSIGDTAEFCYGKERKFENLNKVMLESGDVLIFGGKSRLVFHGVSGLRRGTAPHWLTQTTSLRPGRLNLTFRQIFV